jgi:hypothetical protein
MESKDSQEFFYNLTVYAGLVTSGIAGLGIKYPEFYREWADEIALRLTTAKPEGAG